MQPAIIAASSKQSSFPHDDTLAIIFSFLDVKDMLSIASVCSTFRQASKRPDAYDGFLDFYSFNSDDEVEKLIFTIMPERTCIKKIRIDTDLYHTLRYSFMPRISIRFPVLQHLRLSYCRVIDSHMAYIKDLPLQTLEINSGENITDKGISYLRNMPLHKLHLDYFPLITDNSLIYFAEMPLHRLEMRACSQITSEGLANFPALERITYID